MKFMKKYPFTPKSVLIVLMVAILSVSCQPYKILQFSDVVKGKSPEVIKLQDSTQYTIYSYKVGTKISGDSLIIFDKKNKEIFAMLGKPSIVQMIDTKTIHRDSPVSIAFSILPLFIILN